MKFGRVFFGLLAIIMVMSISVAAARAGTIYVGPGGNCGRYTPCSDTIQYGIEAADDIATLEIAQGTYIENLSFPEGPSARQRNFACDGIVTIDGSLTVQNGAVVFDSGVFVVQDQGLTPVTVPDVVGLEKTTAKTALAVANLTTGDETNRGSDTVAVDHVMGQNPDAGVSMAPGNPVDIVVSLGEITVEVPDVFGMGQEEARNVISNAGLDTGATVEQHSETVALGCVINQSPLGGSIVNWDVSVDIMVSLGSGGGGLPPEPSTVATEIDETTIASMDENCEFLYVGQDPIQKGVMPGTVEEHRIGVIRGKVVDSAGAPSPVSR